MRAALLGLFLFSFHAHGQDAESIHAFLDNWHLAAAKADEHTFFDAIADDGIYIGTDENERWTKSEFLTFAKPYFDRGRAWDFKPRERDVHWSSDGNLVWFSELLDTWMGVCRGSGVLQKVGSSWKLKQYHLSVTVPNDVIDSFIKMVDGYKSGYKK